MSSTVIPTLRYQDAPAAIAFLSGAFGFEPTLVVDGEGGSIEHAQLVHGSGMVMLGSVRDNAYGRAIRDAGPSGAVYVIVEDVYAHAVQARTAGAEIVMQPEEQDYGGASYTAKDPEGNIWSFGSYNPWKETSS